MPHDTDRYEERHAEQDAELRAESPRVGQAVAAVVEDTPDAETVRRAADRVWGRLSAEAATAATASDTAASDTASTAPASTKTGALETCADYQALIPAYMDGSLSPARRMLLEDHSRECVSCRRALIAARKGEATPATVAAPAARRANSAGLRRWTSLAAAAVLALMVAGFGYMLWDGWFQGGTVATVATVDGSLLSVEDADGPAATMAALAGGAEIAAGEPVRTAKGSSAVVALNDGSLVELAERTQVRVRERRSGSTIFVDRGSIIVEAAQQTGRRHLYVSTDEARVEVVGTIFAVQHGVKGSRVSVVEGEVKVRQGGEESVLHPGMQVTSRASLAAVPITEEISWSRNFDQYVALLSELNALRDEIARNVAPTAIRYASDLAPRVPADSLIYVALPNVSGELAESYDVFQRRLAESPVLAQWWEEIGDEGRDTLNTAVGHLRDVGGYLGPEVVLAVSDDDLDGDPDGPVILTALERPDSFRAYLEQEMARLADEHGDEALEGLVLVESLSDLPTVQTGGEGDHMWVWLGDGLLVASPNADRLRAAVTGDSGFADTRLGQTVGEAYADGTQWLLAADLATLMADDLSGEAADDAGFAASGMGDLSHLVVERWSDAERTVMSADLAFAGPRRGIASWLAAPAPMGTLDFVSGDASLAAAFVVKEPAAMLDDVAAMAAAEGGDAGEGFAELEQRLGLSVRDDIAATLGGEVAFALDGPFLPEPSWKLILEVYDPATLQHSLETAVAEANVELQAEGEAALQLTSETAGGRTWHRLVGRGDETGEHEMNWVFSDGYMVLAPSRALLERTLDQRDAGSTLTASARFRNLLPRDGEADFSALFFQHLGPLLSPLASGAANFDQGSLSEEQKATLSQLMADAEPSLVYAYGREDSITVAGTGPGGPFGIGALGGLATLAPVMDAAID